MNLKDILSISGYPDLYKLVAQARTGIIVESIVTKKRMQAFASSRISSLEDIAIYTEDGEVPLKDVFFNMFEKAEGKPSISHNSSANEIKKVFAEALPEYDRERVYVSDMKRIVKWYNLFIEKEILTKEIIEESKKEAQKDEKEESKEKAEKEQTEDKSEKRK